MDGKFIAMTHGRCPGLWSYYEFFSTLDEDGDEDEKGDWKVFGKKDDAIDYLYKHFIPALYMNGNAITEYPVNKFTGNEKGNLSDTFYLGRDGRSWMLDPEGSHIVYCCAMAQDNEFGVGIHWGNDIELSLPVPPRSEPAHPTVTVQDAADLKAVEGALRDGMRFGKNRICVRSDSTRVVERLNADIDEHFQFGEGNHVGRYNSANYYRKYESSGCQEIIKLVNQLMCVSIQKVEKTDKNYHRARKLAHEGRNMVRIVNQTQRNLSNKRAPK